MESGFNTNSVQNILKSYIKFTIKIVRHMKNPAKKNVGFKALKPIKHSNNPNTRNITPTTKLLSYKN